MPPAPPVVTRNDPTTKLAVEPRSLTWKLHGESGDKNSIKTTVLAAGGAYHVQWRVAPVDEEGNALQLGENEGWTDAKKPMSTVPGAPTRFGLPRSLEQSHSASVRPRGSSLTARESVSANAGSSTASSSSTISGFRRCTHSCQHLTCEAQQPRSPGDMVRRFT